MKNPERISVIIPTVNAYAELDLALTSLKQNSACKIDFVVVVDPDLKTGDVSAKILEVCKKQDIKPWINEKNLGPYGSWNKGAELAATDWLVFATDDQYFAPHWDTNLLKYWQPKRLVAGHLVEPGIIPVYKTNVEQNFGAMPSEFRQKEFITWCRESKQTGFTQDGFFIPLLQSRHDFDVLGHYPTEGQFGTSGAVSNDYSYIENARKLGYQFGTATDSYSYHFQASSWKKKTLSPTIAAVVLTQNSQRYLEECLSSLNWVTDIFIVDGGSTDNTLAIARKHKAHITKNVFESFAAQRNVALSEVATYDWVVMIDADETVEQELKDELLSYAKDIYLDGVEVPRKNYIFGKWIEHTDWYPDYRLVFFRPKMATYEGDVHERVHFLKGNGRVVQAKHNILHKNYQTVEEFVTKNLVRYPREYAQVLQSQGVRFSASEMLSSSLSEFMRRFFLKEGWRDGMHGLLLSLLMGTQNLVSHIYLWEMQGKNPDLTHTETQAIFTALRKKGSELTYWLTTMAIESSQGTRKLYHRISRKALKLVKGL